MGILLSVDRRNAREHPTAENQLQAATCMKRYQHYNAMVLKSISRGLENPTLPAIVLVIRRLIQCIMGEVRLHNFLLQWFVQFPGEHLMLMIKPH